MACRLRKPGRKLSVGGVLSSTASGAAAGSVGGPVGSIIGGIVGLGAGLVKDRREKKDSLEQERQLLNQPSYQSLQRSIGSVQGSPRNIPLLPMGGIIPYNSETVELEKGEPFMQPNGQIDKISDNAPTHAQGGVPITLPSGTKVLGKKPATDEKTFKELGSKLEKQQKKYQKILDNKPSRIEEETATRMLAKVNKEFNNLFELQGEDTQSNQMFQDGGKVAIDSTLPGQTAAQEVAAAYRPAFLEQQSYGDFEKADYGDLLSSIPLYSPVNRDSIIAVENRYKGVPGPQYFPAGFAGQQGSRMEKYQVGDTTRFAGSETPQLEYGGKIRKGQHGLQAGDIRAFQKFAGITADNIYGPQTEEAFANLGQDFYNTRNTGQALQPLSGTIPVDYTTLENQSLQRSGLTQPTVNTKKSDVPQGTGFNVGNAFSTVASLAPVAYNLYQGMRKPEQIATNAFTNPYTSEVRATMRDRRYNIAPELEQARLSAATYARNLREAAPTQAQYLGGLQSAAIAQTRATAEAIARKQNVENQYLAEQAQMDYTLGAADAERQRYIEDINARSRAAQRQFTQQGLTQLGQFAQTKQQMNNQMVRDAQRLNLLPSLVQNFTFNSDGSWTFKKTGEVMQSDQVWDFIRGNNLNR